MRPEAGVCSGANAWTHESITMNAGAWRVLAALQVCLVVYTCLLVLKAHLGMLASCAAQQVPQCGGHLPQAFDVSPLGQSAMKQEVALWPKFDDPCCDFALATSYCAALAACSSASLQ